MGYYLQIDDAEPVPIASLNGWGDVIRWAERLSPDAAPALHHLTRFGWEDDAAGLVSQLDTARRLSPPRDVDTQETLQNLSAVLASHKGPITVVSITDGMGSDDGQDDKAAPTQPNAPTGSVGAAPLTAEQAQAQYDAARTDREKIDALILLCLAALILIGQQYERGEMAAAELPAFILPVLADFHARAGVIGRNAAGDTAPPDDVDAAFGQEQAQSDGPFLENFARQLEQGWGRQTPDKAQTPSETPPGAENGPSVSEGANPAAASVPAAIEAVALSMPALINRLSLYASRLYASAHEAFVLASPEKATFTWHLDDGVFRHCPDCPRLAAGGPYTADTLPTWPGSGETACLTRCRCWLERDDGKQPFKL